MTTPAAENPIDRFWAAARACDRQVSGVRPFSMRERLADLLSDPSSDPSSDVDGRGDLYGDGVTAALEARVAGLLGKPAAVFFPTGTMAQQVALRCWAQRAGNPAVAMHPLNHLEVHEREAYQVLSGLRPVWLTREPRPPTSEEVRSLDEPFGTLLLELPLRDPGYLLPTWSEFTELVAAARDRGAYVHLDGARLWESTPYLGQDLATVAAQADSVYVSFYKTLGGISGAVLAGPEDFVSQARAWRHRYGGNVFQHWPAVLAAQRGLDRELPRLGSYVEHAAAVARVLAALPGARVHPVVPHTHQFQLWLPGPAEALTAAAYALAAEEKSWFAGGWKDIEPTGLARTEITVAAPALELTVDEVAAIAHAFLALSPRS